MPALGIGTDIGARLERIERLLETVLRKLDER